MNGDMMFPPEDMDDLTDQEFEKMLKDFLGFIRPSPLYHKAEELATNIGDQYSEESTGNCRYCGTDEHVCGMHGVCRSCHVIHFDERIGDQTALVKFLGSKVMHEIYTGEEDELLSALILLMEIDRALPGIRAVAQARREAIDSGNADEPMEIPDPYKSFFS